MKYKKCIICGKTFPEYMFDDANICSFCFSSKILDKQIISDNKRQNAERKKSQRKYIKSSYNK